MEILFYVIDKRNNDATDKMKICITDESGQTAVKEKEEDKSLIKGKTITGPGFGNIFKDGPIQLRPTGNFAKLMSDDKPRGNKVIDKNNKDATFVQDSPRTPLTRTTDRSEDILTAEPGKRAANKKDQPLIKDKPLIMRKKITGVGVVNIDEGGPKNRPTTWTSANPVSDDTPTENKGRGRLSDGTHLRSGDPLDKEAEHGSDFLDECSQKGRGRLSDGTHLRSGDPLDKEAEHGSDFLDECSQKTNDVDGFRPEATCVDNMSYVDVGQMFLAMNMDITQSLEKDKHRLKQRLFSGQRIQSFSQEIRDVLKQTVEKYTDFKTKLLELCSDLVATAQIESFKNNMSGVTEMRFARYEEELKCTRTMLKNMTDEFEIVVSGETSSGKSTFLNVLLGERILPSHHLHTTASLCRLHNSKKRRIEYNVGNGIGDSITLTSDSSELREKLESITKELLSKDGDNEPLQTIDIYWPVPSLHENVVLVDTPGIGERDALTKQVVEYVPKSAGYIFIIDSSHAGGVQDSGIRKLIEAIAASASKEDHIKELQKAIFVCNKWDLVKKQFRKDVLENTRKKIGKYCGQLEEWQMIQFNADLELQLLNLKANPTDDFKMLLKSLETLMIRTIEIRLGDTHRWLHTFVMEVKGLVTARMRAAELSKEKVQTEIKKAREELELATKGLEQCSEVEALIDTEEKLLLQALQEYLKSEDVRRKHFDWTNGAPELSKVEEDGPKLIIARLEDAILEWATAETGPLKQASVRITDKCMQMQAKLDSRISNLNSLELGFSFLRSSDETGSSSPDESDSLSAKGIAIILATTPIWVTAGLVVLVIGLIPGIVWTITRAFRTKRIIKQMTKMTEQVIDLVSSDNHLQIFITESFTDPHSKWVTKFKNDSQCKIDSTRETVQQMEQDLHMNKDMLQMFKPLQTKLNECSKCLQALGKDI